MGVARSLCTPQALAQADADHPENEGAMMNLDEGGEDSPPSGLMRLMQGLSPRPRRRGLFGSEYARFMGARRPSAAQLFALADHLRGGGRSGGVASDRPTDATVEDWAAGAGGKGPSDPVLQPVEVLTSQGPVQKAELSKIPDRLTKYANGTFADGDFYFLPIVGTANDLWANVPKAERSIEYLAASPAAREAIAGMTANRVPTNIMHFDRRRDDGARDQIRKMGDRVAIEWDPTWALKTQNVDSAGNFVGVRNEFSSNGQVQSPALMWFHEMDHALNYLADLPAFQRRVAATRRNGYDDQEEQRVIDGPERTVAQQLGEPTRTNHRGGDHWTDDPTFHGRVLRR